MITTQEIQIKTYLEEVEQYLPYSKEKRNQILIELEAELNEATHEGTKSPYGEFGPPKLTAKNLVKGDLEYYNPASWFSRISAYLIDTFVIGVLLWIFFGIPYLIADHFYNFEAMNNNTDLSSSELIFIIFFSIYGITIFVAVLSLYILPEKIYSQSIGKKVMGIRVLDKSGIKIDWKQAVVRNLVKFQTQFIWLEFVIGYLMRKEGENFQKATDLISETMVVR